MWVVAALALATVAAVPASARERFPIHGERYGAPFRKPFYDYSLPALVDGGVAYVDEPGKRAHLKFRPPGGPSRRLEQFEPFISRAPESDTPAHLFLDGSGDLLALSREDGSFGVWDIGFGGVVVATLTGPAQTIASCRYHLGWNARLDGSALAMLSGPPSAPCRKPFRRRVYDLASGKAHTLPVGDRFVSYPDPGGRYAVWSEDAPADAFPPQPRGFVYDYRRGRFVNRRPDANLLAVSHTGTVVGAAPEGDDGYDHYHECTNLVTLHAGDAKLVALPYRTCRPYAAIPVGDRIAFLAAPPGRPLGGPRQRVMLGDVSGSPPIPLTEAYRWNELGYGSDFGFGYDFDGERVAYRLYDCVGRRQIAVDEVATAVAEGPMPIPHCNATIDAPEAPVDIAEGFDVAVECPAGCRGSFAVRWESGSTYLVPRRRHWHWTLSPGRHALHLSAPEVEPAGDAVVDATLKFRVFQPDANQAPFTTQIRIREPGG